MKKHSIYARLLCLVSLFGSFGLVDVNAQALLTKEQILSMTTDELSELPLDELMQAVETLGVSSVDELFALIMNKNVSSASKSEENSFVSPLSTTVITKAEMRSYGISTIEEAFRLIPGMIVTEKTNGMYDIQMRGLNNIPDNNMLLYTENANTLLMVDGRPMQNHAMAALNFDFLHISVEDVERIEVVRGACGALYGANAVSGVINIITEKPSEESKFAQGSFQMGNKNTYVADLALRRSFNSKFAIGLTANIQHRERGTDQVFALPDGEIFYCNDRSAIGTSSPDPMTYMLSGQLAPLASGGQWFSVSDANNLVTLTPGGDVAQTTYTIVEVNEANARPDLLFPNSRLARETMAFNGYISVKPSKDVHFDLSSGYQKSYALSTPVGFSSYSLIGRSSKSFYVNVLGSIHDFSFNVGTTNGSQDFAIGTPGFKTFLNSINADAFYDFKIGGLSIRPAVNYQWVKYSDYLPVYNNNPQQTGDYSWHNVKKGTPENSVNRLYGFLNPSATIWSIAPSLRLDYRLNDWRFICAFRADKTNIPDKWNPSWQIAVNNKINERNFIRLVYGRANRGACLTNTGADYMWRRPGKVPELLTFNGNEEHNLVSIDNFELGYRWQPVQSILVDAELYFSTSRDYGALMSDQSMFVVEGPDIATWLGKTLGYTVPQKIGAMMTGNSVSFIRGEGNAVAEGVDYNSLHQAFYSRVDVKYKNLPYKVNQFGLSVNLDWIISPKLIAKVNANVQQTRINDYYFYSQNQQIREQLFGMDPAKPGAMVQINQNMYSGCLVDELSDFVATMLATKQASDANEAMAKIFGKAEVYNYMSRVNWDAKSDAEKVAIENGLKVAGLQGQTYVDEQGVSIPNPLTMYCALRYNVRFDSESGQYFFGSTSATVPPTRNNYKHKATPSVYGMIGLVYKPIDQLSVSAYANFVGKRTFSTAYGVSELDNRLTMNLKVGYKPVSNCEIFFNAHNLFNTDKPEFSYCDNIGGLYTVGLNFGF